MISVRNVDHKAPSEVYSNFFTKHFGTFSKLSKKILSNKILFNSFLYIHLQIFAYLLVFATPYSSVLIC